jgi:hypothetical protein
MRPFPRSGLKCFLAQRLTFYALLAGVGICESGCANVASIPSPPQGPLAISVTVTPSSGSVMLGNQFLFTAAVKNSSDTTVNWSVNGVAGGAAQTGTISAEGVYTAPGDLPIPANLTVHGDQPCGRQQIRIRNCHRAERRFYLVTLWWRHGRGAR